MSRSSGSDGGGRSNCDDGTSDGGDGGETGGDAAGLDGSDDGGGAASRIARGRTVVAEGHANQSAATAAAARRPLPKNVARRRFAMRERSLFADQRATTGGSGGGAGST
ncbi:MAG: hypothetical protein AAGN82_29570 [Myxococcota bacterium]